MFSSKTKVLSFLFLCDVYKENEILKAGFFFNERCMCVHVCERVLIEEILMYSFLKKFEIVYLFSFLVKFFQ